MNTNLQELLMSNEIIKNKNLKGGSGSSRARLGNGPPTDVPEAGVIPKPIPFSYLIDLAINYIKSLCIIILNNFKLEYFLGQNNESKKVMKLILDHAKIMLIAAEAEEPATPKLSTEAKEAEEPKAPVLKQPKNTFKNLMEIYLSMYIYKDKIDTDIRTELKKYASNIELQDMKKLCGLDVIRKFHEIIHNYNNILKTKKVHYRVNNNDLNNTILMINQILDLNNQHPNLKIAYQEDYFGEILQQIVSNKDNTKIKIYVSKLTIEEPTSGGANADSENSSNDIKKFEIEELNGKILNLNTNKYNSDDEKITLEIESGNKIKITYSDSEIITIESNSEQTIDIKDLNSYYEDTTHSILILRVDDNDIELPELPESSSSGNPVEDLTATYNTIKSKIKEYHSEKSTLGGEEIKEIINSDPEESSPLSFKQIKYFLEGGFGYLGYKLYSKSKYEDDSQGEKSNEGYEFQFGSDDVRFTINDRKIKVAEAKFEEALYPINLDEIKKMVGKISEDGDGDDEEKTIFYFNTKGDTFGLWKYTFSSETAGGEASSGEKATEINISDFICLYMYQLPSKLGSNTINLKKSDFKDDDELLTLVEKTKLILEGKNISTENIKTFKEQTNPNS